MDHKYGRMLNANFDQYKIAGTPTMMTGPDEGEALVWPQRRPYNRRGALRNRRNSRRVIKPVWRVI